VEVYSGDDAMTLPLLAVGAVGVVGVCTHWASPVFVEMVDAISRGDLDAARAANAKLMSSFAYETSEANPYPVPAKRMLRELGLPGGQCRLPHVEVDGDSLAASARKIIDELGVTGWGPGVGREVVA
jgi:4-hydroxy-tetrahydrodipicolinate synthase